MTITLKAMRYFTTALRLGNIAKAADELNIAASAVASAIDQIEAHFDLTLTTRHRSRGIQPTASGLAMARKFERLLDDYQSMLVEGRDLKESLSGTLRLGYYAPVAPAFLPRILASAGLLNPDVRLNFVACDNDAAQSGLLSGAFDAILFVSDGARPTVEFDLLIEAPAYCLLPERHPLAGQCSLRLEQIAGQPIIVLDRPFATEYYERIFAQHGVTPQVAAYADSTEMVRSLVGAGLGAAILNMLPLTDISYAGDHLVACPIAEPLPPLGLAVGYNKSAPRRLVTEFVTACHAHFAKPGRDRCVIGM